MDNPYFQAEIKPHHLDREVVRSLCFEAHGILCASYVLGRNFEAAEEDFETSSVWKLHYERAEPRLSQLLLQIAVFVRTFDDIMSTGPHAEAYGAHAAATSGENVVGVLTTPEGPLPLREACNKIIHATDFRPVYEHVERDPGGGQPEETAWHLTSEIELQGRRGKENWEAVVWLENFLEVVLDRVAFDPG